MDLKKQLKKLAGMSTPDDQPTPSPTPQREPEPEPLMIQETSPQAVHARLAAGEAVTLLDVRQPWDFAAQHPEGALSLPLNDLPDRLNELDPTKSYVLSCYHGYTSLNGVAFLMEKGFVDVQSMSGGFSGWAAAGLPIESAQR